MEVLNKERAIELRMVVEGALFVLKGKEKRGNTQKVRKIEKEATKVQGQEKSFMREAR
jgi:hypothetical protein